MANLATLSFQASHPVRIDWGDGTVVVAGASPVSHLYAVAGQHEVTLTDTVNGQVTNALTDCGPMSWNGIAASYATWNAVSAANPTWDEVLNG
jgi:hypothetical protein